jgi:hypothetical protein
MPNDTCETCRYYKEIANDKGVCRRVSPCPVDPRVNGNVTTWPKVKPNDWCGEWKIIIP